MRNLQLHGMRKLRDRLVGPLVMTQRIGETEYWLDLSSHAALHGVHNVFHLLLLQDWQVTVFMLMCCQLRLIEKLSMKSWV